jgi:hypothetical protein
MLTPKQMTGYYPEQAPPNSHSYNLITIFMLTFNLFLTLLCGHFVTKSVCIPWLLYHSRTIILQYKRSKLNENISIFTGSILGWATMLQAGRSQVWFLIKSLNFFSLPNPSSRIMALVSTQPLTEISTRKFPGRVKGGRHIRLTTLPPSVSWLPIKCGSLDL